MEPCPTWRATWVSWHFGQSRQALLRRRQRAQELLYRREATRSNEIWQADHTPLDLWVLDERGRAARPWFTVVLDDYSRAVAGYALSLHAPSSIQTALALRQAIWRK